MNALTRKLALRAAAKVAFAGTLIACEKTQTPTIQPTSNETKPTSTGTATTPTPTPTSTTGACNVKDVDHPTPSEVTCCTDVVHAGVKASGKLDTTPQIACCKALAKNNDALMSAGHGGQESMPERWACCEALQWNGGMTCTPWGPPVPPAIDWIA